MPILSGQTARAVSFDQGTYTPVLTAATTNPTLGSGSSQVGWWKRIDNLIVGGASIIFGTSGVAAGSGTYYVSLPFAADTTFMIASLSSAGGSVLGGHSLRDNSVPAVGGGWCQLADTADKVFLRDLESSSFANNALPWVWAASDRINISFAYQADPAVL